MVKLQQIIPAVQFDIRFAAHVLFVRSNPPIARALAIISLHKPRKDKLTNSS